MEDSVVGLCCQYFIARNTLYQAMPAALGMMDNEKESNGDVDDKICQA